MAHPPLAGTATRQTGASRPAGQARDQSVPQGRRAVDTPAPQKVSGLSAPTSALIDAVSAFFPAIESLKQKFTADLQDTWLECLDEFEEGLDAPTPAPASAFPRKFVDSIADSPAEIVLLIWDAMDQPSKPVRPCSTPPGIMYASP